MSQRGSKLEEAIRTATDPASVLERVVEEATVLSAPAAGACVLLLAGENFTGVCGAGIMSGAGGLKIPVESSLAGDSIRHGLTLFSDDVRVDPRVSGDLISMTPAVSLVSVPLRYAERPIGALVVASPDEAAFGVEDVAVLHRLADFVSTVIAVVFELNRITLQVLEMNEDAAETDVPNEPATVARFVANVLQPESSSDIEWRERIEEILEGGMVTFFQPIMELDTGRVVGAEALTRFPEGRPEEWFDHAHKLGLGVSLEKMAVELALSQMDILGEESYLAVNLSPLALTSPDVVGLFDEVDPKRIVLELTEHLRVEDYQDFRQTISEFRRHGFRLAIDDTGAGFASLSHIIELGPDLIKLNLDLTRGIDRDPVRRSLAASLVAFAADTGPNVIAEGIETEAELETLLELGIGFGQGYLLGRPAPPAELRLLSRR